MNEWRTKRRRNKTYKNIVTMARSRPTVVIIIIIIMMSINREILTTELYCSTVTSITWLILRIVSPLQPTTKLDECTSLRIDAPLKWLLVVRWQTTRMKEIARNKFIFYFIKTVLVSSSCSSCAALVPCHNCIFYYLIKLQCWYHV